MAQKSIMKCFTTVEELGIVYENHQKSLILRNCERSERSLLHNFTVTLFNKIEISTDFLKNGI